MIRFTQGLLAGALTVVVMVGLVALPAGASFPGANGRLAFAVPIGGDQIVSVKANGKGERIVTEGSDGASRDPSFSAFGPLKVKLGLVAA